jgi:hypothetical protein
VVVGNLQRLSSWLVEAGGHHDGVELRELGEMHGVVATRPIPRGSEVVRVPRSLLITLQTALGRLSACCTRGSSSLPTVLQSCSAGRRDARSLNMGGLDTPALSWAGADRCRRVS